MRSEDLSLSRLVLPALNNMTYLPLMAPLSDIFDCAMVVSPLSLTVPEVFLSLKEIQKGDGRFEDDERDAYIAQALSAIAEKL